MGLMVGLVGILAIASTPVNAQLLTDAEIIELVVGSEQLENNWFGLAGLAKLEHPPELPDELVAYRESWRRKDPAIAPFLGFWHDSDYSANRYYLSIFPSRLDDHVCVVEFKPEWSLGILAEGFEPDVISEGIFSLSLAKAGAAQLQGENIRADELAIAATTFGIVEDYPVELFPLYDAQNRIRLVAAANVPQLPPDLPATFWDMTQEFLEENHCL